MDDNTLIQLDFQDLRIAPLLNFCYGQQQQTGARAFGQLWNSLATDRLQISSAILDPALCCPDLNGVIMHALYDWVLGKVEWFEAGPS